MATGIMWFASIGANSIWPLAWVATAPLLALVHDLRPIGAALAALVAGSIGASNLAIAYSGALPVAWLIGLVLLTSVPFAAIVVVWRMLERRLPAAFAAVAYAAIVVAVEFVMSTGSPNGTFGSIAYSQADVVPVLQIASITGLWGISFLVSLVNAGVALAWRTRRQRSAALASLAVAVVPLVGAVMFGVVRLASGSPSAQVRVGLAASDASVPAFNTTSPQTATGVVTDYGERVARLANRGAQAVVLPEKFVGVTPAYADAVRAILSRTARDHHVTIVAGFNELPDSGTSVRARNAALVISPNGQIVLRYDKVHLVPGLESAYEPGRDAGVFILSGVRTGVAICKDLDFAPLGRTYGQAGVALLLVPAWDFVHDGWLHSRMAIVRSVENGYALARTASEGRLTVTDARGRMIVEAVSSAAPEVLITAAVPVARGGTFYSRTGDWFAWYCLVMAIVFGVITVLPRSKTKAAPRPH